MFGHQTKNTEVMKKRKLKKVPLDKRFYFNSFPSVVQNSMTNMLFEKFA